jgi:hypothetical protein
MAELFREEPIPERRFPAAAVGIATVAVVILLTVVVLLGRRHGASLDPAYAANLAVDSLQMSESTSLSGGKSTFVDGRVTNRGPLTVTGATVQVLFRNDETLPPQAFTLPLTLIRTREPYVDTEPMSAEPLAPGASREFRLIFENINANWNGQLPEVHVTGAAAH